MRNVNKYLNIYYPGAKPLFIEDDQFKTIIPLASSRWGEEKAMAFIELVGLDKLKLKLETIEAIEALDLDPKHAEISDINDLFFADGNSLGWSWSKKEVELKSLRIKINSKLQIDDSFKGWSWSKKGVELLDKRTMTLFKILLLCLYPQSIEGIQKPIEFNSRNRLREMYLNPLREAGLLEYTIKEKPNSSNQKYLTTEKGRMLLGGFEL